MIISKADAMQQRKDQIARVKSGHSEMLYKIAEDINSLHVPFTAKEKVWAGINEMLYFLGADSIKANKANKLIKNQ